MILKRLHPWARAARCLARGGAARVLLTCGLFALPMAGLTQSLTVPDGNLETPVVAAWSTTLPTSWTWSPDSGAGGVGLTSTGSAKGSQRCLYGNQIAGNLTSDVLPQVLSAPGVLTPTDSAKPAEYYRLKN
jgi:hypothetical protein